MPVPINGRELLTTPEILFLLTGTRTLCILRDWTEYFVSYWRVWSVLVRNLLLRFVPGCDAPIRYDTLLRWWNGVKSFHLMSELVRESRCLNIYYNCPQTL